MYLFPLHNFTLKCGYNLTECKGFKGYNFFCKELYFLMPQLLILKVIKQHQEYEQNLCKQEYVYDKICN